MKLLKNKIVIALVSLLLICSVSVGLVSAQSPSPTPDYTAIPTVTPSASPTPTLAPGNQTNTVDNNNSTYVNYNDTRIESLNGLGTIQEYSSYNMTTVCLLFAESISCAVNASGGHWGATQDSAGQIAFYPYELGQYEIHFQVIYNRQVTQPVVLKIYSGDGYSQIIPFNSDNYGFTLDIALTVYKLPDYPSADEIAEAQDAKMAERDAENQAKIQQIVDGSNTQSSIAMVLAVVFAVVGSIVVYLIIRHQRHVDARTNELNANGFGRGRL